MSDDVPASWNKYAEDVSVRTEQRANQENDIETQSARYEDQQSELYPRRRLLHRFFILFSIITALTGLSLGAGQFIGLGFDKVSTDVNEWVHYILTIFIIAMCAMLVFTELEFGSIISGSKLLMFWPTRGLIYFFLGVLSLEQKEISNPKDMAGGQATLKFLEIVSYIMIGCGMIYFCFGVLCFQIVLNKMREGYQARLLQSIEKRKKIKRNPRLLVSNPGLT